MRVSRYQLRKIIQEAKLIKEAYNSASEAGVMAANAAKRKFLKLYPDVDVQIDKREGWVIVNGVKAINIASSSGRPLTDDEMITQMEDALSGGVRSDKKDFERGFMS